MDSEKKKDPEDKLFREAMADVSPLNPDKRIPRAREKPTVTIRPPEIEDDPLPVERLLSLETLPDGDEDADLIFLRPGYQKRILKRLRRGHYGIRDVLDLHHMKQHTARGALDDFITYSLKNGFRCVQIIHGKGLRSVDGPRLKIMSRQVLRKYPQVIAFTSCRPEDGGSGAVIVLLQLQREVTP
jgi:DNA-nicking Smr family endonuclease